MTKASTILANPYLNKGTAFSLAERRKLGLLGTLPPKVRTIEEQATEVYAQFQTKQAGIEQRDFLMAIFNTNRTLFFYLMGQHLEEMMPIVYDPVIADSIENYSQRFLQPQQAAFLSIDDPATLRQRLQNAAAGRDIKLIVVTDGEGILGIGDWGINGVDIAVGKLMVYTAAAGIDPASVLAVGLDVGTNNESLLNDPAYLGLKHRRVTGAAYDQLIDGFVTAAHELFPTALLHFEDFGRANAAQILWRYQDQLPIFNDDIQGTGMIALAGVLGALKLSGQRLADQKFLTFGAGTAGMGIAKMLFDEMVRQGMAPAEAKRHFYLVDVQGLLFDDTPNLTPEQREFTRQRAEFANAVELTDLLAVVKAVQPTVMIGTSKQPGAFSEAVVKEMAAHVARPIIFPISNPTKLIEAMPADLLKWTAGRALVAAGIPVPDVTLNGQTYRIGQANNALVYPGVGFGAIAVKAKRINEAMLAAAAHALADIVDVNQAGAAVLPPVAQLPAFTAKVAEVVAQTALDQGLAAPTITDAKQAVAALRWQAKY